MFINLVISLTALLGALSLSYMVWQHAYRFGLQDIPNERSSHAAPIPRGGGIAIFANFLLTVVVAYNVKLVDRNWLQVFCFGGLLVFLIGLWDDRWSLPARARLVVHFVAALWTMIFVTQGLAGAYKIDIGVATLSGVFLCGAFGILFIAWMINLYNFMDGIDGQAGGIGLLVALVLAGLSYYIHAASWVLFLSLAACIAGFLAFNWHPAKIFMGDCGSGFLGFAFSALALLGELRGGLPLTVTTILLSTFVVDSTYTLIVRVLLGHRPYEPHREFTFQRFIQRGWKPSRFVFLHGAAILFYNAPLAFLTILYPQYAGLFLVAGYAPYILLAVQLKSGFPIYAGKKAKEATPVISIVPPQVFEMRKPISNQRPPEVNL